MSILPAHSPLGASGASRWMKCPASVSFASGITDESSEHAALGTAAHALAETCLSTGTDAWEWIGGGYVVEGQEATDLIPCDKDMADAVQQYLDAVRKTHPDRNQSNAFVERKFHCPQIHPAFYGTSDFCHLDGDTVHVWDYKHGAGIVVEVKENPQLMYYAVGMIEDLNLWNTVKTVVLYVAQPRGFHFDGPIRSWAMDISDLKLWLHEELLPAMDNAGASEDTASGEHCRFCPARSRACPQLIADMKEMETLMKKAATKEGVKALTNAQVGRFLTLYDTAKIVAKAANTTAFSRLQAGKKIPGRKLASSRTNRTWKEGAEEALRGEFGDKAFTDPELKSPAKIDALPGGDAASARWAYKPEGGLVVVSGNDSRIEVSKDTKSLFSDKTKGTK